MAEKVDLWRDGGPFGKLTDEKYDEFEQQVIDVGGVDIEGRESVCHSQRGTELFARTFG